MNNENIFSWTIIENTAISKKMDKSFYTTGVTGIPKDIRWFFGCEKDLNEKLKVGIWYNDERYEGIIEFYSGQKEKRTRLFTRNFYSKNKGTILKYTNIMFSKISEYDYSIKLFNETEVEEDVLENPFETKVIIDSEKGKKLAFFTTKYERINSIREQVIKAKGLKCQICGFDFENKYGFYGKNFIDIHHIKPLYSLNEEITPNVDDFISICSNCHRIIHRGINKMITPEELKMLIKEKEEIDDLFG